MHVEVAGLALGREVLDGFALIIIGVAGLYWTAICSRGAVHRDEQPGEVHRRSTGARPFATVGASSGSLQQLSLALPVGGPQARRPRNLCHEPS